jgi:hypothetical protein
MSGSQMFILIFLLGGAFAFGFFMMGLGVYYWGRGLYEKSKKDNEN